MKFMHISDVHLGARPDPGRPYSAQRKEELWETLRRVLCRAKESRIDFLFITGDLFHRQPIPKELGRLCGWLEEIGGTKVMITAGNHDYLKRGCGYWGMAWPDNVCFLDSAQVMRRRLQAGKTDVYIYGNSYHARENTDRIYDNLVPGTEPGIHILLGHGGDERHIPMDYRRIEEAGFHYVALGHIHRPHIFSSRMAYAGALEPIDRLDTGPHGYIEGEIDDGVPAGEGTKIRFVEAASRRYVPAELMWTPQKRMGQLQQELAKKIEESGKEHLYTICLKGRYQPGRRPDVRRLLEFDQVCAAEDKTQADYDMEKLYSQNQGQLLGEYLEAFRGRELDEEEELAREYGVEALLETRGPS